MTKPVIAFAGLTAAALLTTTTALAATTHPATTAAHADRTSAAGGKAVAGQHRGQVVQAMYLKTLAPAQVDAYVEDHNFDRPHSRYAVSLYRLVYRTTDLDGRPTTASGLVALPERRGRSLRLTAYTHGTISNKDDAASVSDDDTSRAIVLMLGGAGLAVAAPDYLGLGLGPGMHPYGHLASETSASADLITATDRFARNRGLRLQHDVLVSGFSQGGRVAVNLAKQLEQGKVHGFGVKAVAAVAGPFDLEHTELPAAFDGGMDPKSANYYLSYLVTTWKRLVGLYDDPAEAFKPPYDETVEQLFDGHHSFDDIMAGLPETPDELFQPAFVHKLLNPAGAYARLLRSGDASCRGWRPHVPVRLYYGSADREVVPANTASCLRTLHGAQGVNVGPVGHFESWFGSYPRILAWFSTYA